MKRQNRSGRIISQSRPMSGRTGLVVLTAAAMAWASQRTQAANLNWDPAPSTDSANGGGSGGWDLANFNWFNGTTDVQWTDVSVLGTDTAIFGGPTTGTVSLNATLSAADLVFTTAGYSVNGANTLTLGGDLVTGIGIDASALNSGTTTIGAPISLASNVVTGQIWTVGAGSTLVDSGGLSGAAATTLTKSGNGVLTLSGSNTGFAGSLVLAAGQLNVNSATALGTGTFTIQSGTFIDATSGPTTETAGSVHWNGAFTYIGTNNLDLNSSIPFLMGGAAASTRTVIVKSSNLQIDGALTDNSGVGNVTAGDSLSKQGAGTLTLTNGANSYTGNTTIGGGTIALSTTGVLGSATGTLTLTNGALTFSGVGTGATRSQSTGALTDNAGLDTIAMTADPAQPTTFTAASLARGGAGAIEIYRGNSLGSAPGNGVASVMFTAAPAPVLSTGAGNQPFVDLDSVGALNTTSAAVLKGAIVDNGTPTGTGFATYDPTNGVRLLNPATEQVTSYPAATATTNVLLNLTGATAFTGVITNTLQLNNTSGSTQTVTNTGTALQPMNGLLFTGTSSITLTGGSLAFNPSVNTNGDLPIISTDSATVTIATGLTSPSSSNASSYDFGGSGNFTVSGGIGTTKGGGIYVDGPGTVSFTGTTFALSSNGLNVEGGTAKLNSSATLGTSSSLSGTRPWRVAAGATLDMNGMNITYTTAQTANVVDDLSDVNGAGGTITNSSASGGTLTVVTTSETGNVVTFSGNMINNISFVRSVASTGTDANSTSEQVLAGASTYTGATTVAGGYLGLGANNALPTATSALSINNTANATVPSTLDLNGFNQTVASLAGTIGGTAGTFIENDGITATVSTLTVSPIVATTSTTFAGIIRDNNGNATFDGRTGAAVGTVALAKAGVGTLTLTGVNTYSGGTKVSGGLLQIGSAGSIGTAGSTVSVTGGTLLNSGSIVSPVVASGGVLAGTGSYSGGMTLNSSAHLAPGNNSLASVSAASLTLNGGAVLDYDFLDPGSSDEVISAGGLTLNSTSGNPVGLNVFASGTTGKFSPTGATSPETFNLIQYTGTAVAPLGPITNISVLNPVSTTAPWSYVIESDPGAGPGGSNLIQLVLSFPPPETWAGNTSTSWATAVSTGNNWNVATVPNGVGQTVIFPSSAHTFTVDLNGSKTVGALSFTGGTYLIEAGSSPSGGILTLDNMGTAANISNTSGANQTISAPISLAAGFSTNVTNTTSSASVTLSGGITGGATSPLVADGSGILALTGSSPSFHGGVVINGGFVQINSATSLGASDSTATINSGTLEVTTGGIVGSRNFILGSATSTIQIDGTGQTYEIDGNVTDLSGTSPGTLNLTTPGGSGTLILTGTTSNIGGMNIAASSTLQLGNPATTLGANIGGGTLTNAGTINVGSVAGGLAAGTTVNLSSSLAGAGPLNYNPTAGVGSGSLVLSGSNAGFSGAVTVNNGTLILGNVTSTTATGIGNLTLNNATLTENVATSELGSGAVAGTAAAAAPTMTFAGSLSDTIDTGTGTLTIAQQFSGGVAGTPVTINRNGGNGTLILGVAGNTLLGVTAPFGGALFANFTNNVGSLVLAARGAGSANSTYNFIATTGTVTVNGGSGTINLGALNGTQSIGATGVTRLGVGGLNTNSTYSGIIGAALPADIGVAKTGSGTFTLTGLNTYSGVALTNAGLAPAAVVNGALVAGISTAADGSAGAFGPTNGGTAAPGYVLIGNQGQGTGTSAVVLATAALLAAPGVTVANPLVASGGGAIATTTAYTLNMGGAGVGTSTFTGGVILENNLSVTQATGGLVNITGGITGTDADTGPDSTTVVQHGFTGTQAGVAGNNSGFQMITFGGPGSVVVSGSVTTAGPTNPVGNPNGFGIYDSNDPTLSGAVLANGGVGPGDIYENANGLISVSVTGGTTTFASANQYSGGTSVSGGQLIFGNLSPSLAARSVSGLNVSGGVAQMGTASTHAGRNVLILSAGWAIPSTAPTNPINPTPAAAPALAISGSGTLDLTNNDMIVQGVGASGLATINSELKSGYSGNPAGAWTGTGITSSSAGSTHNTALADVLAGSTSSFDGQTVGPNDVLVKYTYFGDANLDGKVSASDYIAIDNGFNTHASGWQNGDFNYDGVINGDDYTLIDNAFNTQGAVVLNGISAGPAEMIATNTDQIAGASSSAVPEPTTLGMLAIGGAGLLMRRRRRGR